MLLAYRLAEDETVRLPVIVNLDGFYLSFTREPVEIPEAADVDRFLPPFDAENVRFRASAPASQAVAVLGGAPYSYFRYQTHLASLSALDVFERAGEEFEAVFGRRYRAVESYRCDDAEYVFVMIGSFSSKARVAVDRLREAGVRIGLVRPRLLRPFPAPQLCEVLAGKRAVAVIDQNLSTGKGGVLHAELASALYGQLGAPPILASFVGGLGGRDIRDQELDEMAAVLQAAARDGLTPEARLLFTEDELREVRKLQAVATRERDEVGARK